MEDDFNDIDDNVMDIDSVGGTDIKINPDFYIHKALIKAQECLADPDMRVGLLRYRQFIEHIEVLCRSAKMLPDTYKESVKSFINEDDYKKCDSNTQSAKLSHFKLELLMSEIFSSKTITDPMRFKNKKVIDTVDLD
jgi:hypothetical protein